MQRPSPHHRRRPAPTLLAALLLGGCQLLLEVDAPQCERDSDCVALFTRQHTCGGDGVCVPPDEAPDPDGGGPGLPPAWACLEEAPRTVSAVPGESITVGFISVAYDSLKVPAGLTARACNATDINCDTPLVDGVTPDEDEYLRFELPTGFPGYFELSADDTLPTLFYSNRPHGDDGEYIGPVLVDPQTVVDLSDRGDSAADLSKGLVTFLFWDCLGQPAGGVTLERNGGADHEVFYFDGGLPDRDLTASRVSAALSVTGEPLAAAGISNIEPGFESFEVIHQESGLPLGTYTAELRPGHMTTVSMYAGY